MNFQNNQQRNNFSQRKGDTKQKPKKLININPLNSNPAEKVVAEKDKKGKNPTESKTKNQWIIAEEENQLKTANLINSDINAYPSLGEPQEMKNDDQKTPETNQLETKPEEKQDNVENLKEDAQKAEEDKKYQRQHEKPLHEANNQNYRKNNNNYGRPYRNQGGNQGYYKKNNYHGGNRHEDDYYEESGYGGDNYQRNYRPKNYNNNYNNHYYQPKKNYETEEKVIYVKKN